MTNPPELQLTVECLCSRWGFNDGDMPDTLMDYWDDHDIAYADIEWHDVLRHLVRTRLVPAIEAAGHTVEVYDMQTIHNPIRARRIDGVEIDGRHIGDVPVPMRVESVTVPYTAIAEACGLPSPDARATGT